jgi:hypothetical protein
MSGIALVGILSGMVFGALAMILRPIAGAVIITPIIASPIAYLYLWRDALNGPCFFATNFNTEACSPTRAFFMMTLQHASDAVTIMVSHIMVGFTLVTILTILRTTIDTIDMRKRFLPIGAASQADDNASDKEPLVDNYRQFHGTPAAVISATASGLSQ